MKIPFLQIIIEPLPGPFQEQDDGRRTIQATVRTPENSFKVEHYLRPDDLDSYFDRVWVYVGLRLKEEMKRWEKRHANQTDNSPASSAEPGGE